MSPGQRKRGVRFPVASSTCCSRRREAERVPKRSMRGDATACVACQTPFSCARVETSDARQRWAKHRPLSRGLPQCCAQEKCRQRQLFRKTASNFTQAVAAGVRRRLPSFPSLALQAWIKNTSPKRQRGKNHQIASYSRKYRAKSASVGRHGPLYLPIRRCSRRRNLRRERQSELWVMAAYADGGWGVAMRRPSSRSCF